MTDIEPRNTEITARLAAQGAMLEELRAVLPWLTPETARADARRAIVEANILQRPSLASRSKIFVKLGQRYFRTGTPRATVHFVHAMQTATDSLQAGLLAYVMLLWNDGLAFRLGCDWLAPRLSGPPFAADTPDIERELELLASEVSHVMQWGPATRCRVAQHYLGLIRDCGFASGSACKQLRRPFTSPTVVLFAVRLLLGSGELPASIPEHPLFTAMGLSISDVIATLSELQEAGRIEFAIQGGVVHLKVLEEKGML